MPAISSKLARRNARSKAVDGAHVRTAREGVRRQALKTPGVAEKAPGAGEP